MEAAQKLKIALDETRMLILGAQVLLGFQLRSAFQDGYARLPTSSRLCDAAALFLMVAVVGLLIAPAAHHRVADEGNATRRTMQIASLSVAGALMLFAFALGINLFIGLERTAGSAAAMGAEIAGAATTLFFWFGIEWAGLMSKSGKDSNARTSRFPLGRRSTRCSRRLASYFPARRRCLVSSWW